MNPDRVLRGTFWAMIVVNTIGAIDMPGKGQGRKLPAPRVYVAVVVLWGLFHLAADMFPRAGRTIAIMSGVTVLASMVVGPFGGVLTGFLDKIARQYGSGVPSNTRSTSTAGAGGPQSPQPVVGAPPLFA